MSNLEIEHTADGSTTLFVKDLDEHYHSVKGAITESEHIYRDCAFLHKCSLTPTPSHLRLLEIGFGTGLNACVTTKATETCRHTLHYFSIEKNPLDTNVISALNHCDYVDATLHESIHVAPWNKPCQITPNFTLEKIHADLLTAELPTDIDVVYFDAFAPEKQPEMWSKEIFIKIYSSMKSGGIMTTYCAKGAIRRLLIECGFMVERIPGPINGKREILRATKQV